MSPSRTTQRPEAPAFEPKADHPDGRVTRGLEVEASDPGHALLQRFHLLVTAGADAGRSFVSTSERSVVGTHERADFRLEDPTVSRFHCEIDLGSGRATLRDLGSLNGTLVEGVSVLGGYLKAGMRLTLGRSQILFEARSDRARLPISASEQFGSLVGVSPAMRRVFKLFEQAVKSDATVLLEGESGTGKEVAAESIHRTSARSQGPFVVVDCGAIAPELLESELFGHERGAFTGAVSSRDGAFAEANGGTIFLDEIGELPLDVQPKLLRALDKRQIKRVGGNDYVDIDVRVVAATNRDLKREVNEKRFRADLYYRLAVIEAKLPALRERLEDLPKLVQSLLQGLKSHYPEPSDHLMSAESLEQLGAHPWPGNVRELRNYLERCLALKLPPSMPTESTPLDQRGSIRELADPARPLKLAREAWTRALERQYLEQILRRHDGNVAAAARAADVDRMHFYRLLWRNGLR